MSIKWHNPDTGREYTLTDEGISVSPPLGQKTWSDRNKGCAGAVLLIGVGIALAWAVLKFLNVI